MERLLLECERICSADEIRMNPEHNQIAGVFVDAIVEQPSVRILRVCPIIMIMTTNGLKIDRCSRPPTERSGKRILLNAVAKEKDDWEIFRKTG